MARLTIPPDYIGTLGPGTVTGDESGVSLAIGIDVQTDGVINTRGGDDSISGTGTGTGTDFGAGIGIGNGGIISGGAGDDAISGTGTGTGTDFGVGIGISNLGSISGGAGDDSISGTGTGTDGTGSGIDNSSGIISGGAGNDTITGSGTSIGIQGGTIDGGCGNDYFKARRIDAQGNPLAPAQQGGAVDNVLITGGKGCDTFNVGYGNATIDGGDGWDKLILLGSSGDYDITGPSNNRTIERDNLVLTVINVEKIVFV